MCETLSEATYCIDCGAAGPTYEKSREPCDPVTKKGLAFGACNERHDKLLRPPTVCLPCKNKREEKRRQELLRGR